MKQDIRNLDFKLIVKENVENIDGETRKFITLELKRVVYKEQFIKEQESVEQPKPEIIESKDDVQQEKTVKDKETTKRKTSKKSEKTSNSQEQVTNQTKSEIEENETKISVNDYEKCLSLLELQDLKIRDKVFKQAMFCYMQDEVIELIIHDDILEEVSNWEIGSAIVPTDILEKGNFKTLKAYKDLGIIKKQKAA